MPEPSPMRLWDMAAEEYPKDDAAKCTTCLAAAGENDPEAIR